MKKLYQVILIGGMILFSLIAKARVTTIESGSYTNPSLLFVENTLSNQYWITPLQSPTPQLVGLNNANISGTMAIPGSMVKGFLADGNKLALTPGNYFDMWLDAAPVEQPLEGLSCYGATSDCQGGTGFSADFVDNKGFYRVKIPTQGQFHPQGILSETLFQYLRQIPVNQPFSFDLNYCQTSDFYVPQQQQRCVDTSAGKWYHSKVRFTKAAHLHLVPIQDITAVSVNSDGQLEIDESANNDCHVQVVAGRSGVSCQVLRYSLESNGVSNNSIALTPQIIRADLAAKLDQSDLQFSLTGQNWYPFSGNGSAKIFNELKTSQSIYIFYSSNYFRQSIALGLSKLANQPVIAFYLSNSLAPDSGRYFLPVVKQLKIKPMVFSISIYSQDGDQNTTREGEVGEGQRDLDFDYVVVTRGQTAADEIKVRVDGPSRQQKHQAYCIFTSDDKVINVPFPAFIRYRNKGQITKKIASGCDNQWHDISDISWLTQPMNDALGRKGEINKSNLQFSIAMNDPISEKTVDGKTWLGSVSASGEIHVKASWKNNY